MSAEKLIRMKVTLPEGVVVQTGMTITTQARFPSRFPGFIESAFDIAKGATVSEVAERFTVASKEVKSNTPITLTLEVPSDKSAELVETLKTLVTDLVQARGT